MCLRRSLCDLLWAMPDYRTATLAVRVEPSAAVTRTMYMPAGRLSTASEPEAVAEYAARPSVENTATAAVVSPRVIVMASPPSMAISPASMLPIPDVGRSLMFFIFLKKSPQSLSIYDARISAPSGQYTVTLSGVIPKKGSV